MMTDIDILKHLNITIDDFNASIKLQKEHDTFRDTLNMTADEYNLYINDEINYINTLKKTKDYEDTRLEDTVYTTEYEFIELNLPELQTFLSIYDIKPIGLMSSRILSDILYRSIPDMSRDIVNEIISNYKIIDIHDVTKKYEHI
jgi:hypothetical protein